MPDLNGMTCTIDIGLNNQNLQESDVQYGNQTVDCSVIVPNIDTSFTVHFKTTSYIAPGLAVFVFIDGQYQANRNKIGSDTYHSFDQIDFRFRQQEELGSHGRFVIGREWRFSALKYAPLSDLPHVNRDLLANLGTIEVVVLRCMPAKSIAHPIATDLGLDGAQDSPSGAVQDGGDFTYNNWASKKKKSASQGQKEAAVTNHASVAAKPTESKAKAYWSAWDPKTRGYGDQISNAQGHTVTFQPRDPHVAPAYDAPQIAKHFADSRGVQIQATTGPGARYSHPRLRPTYLDSMSSPYAVFRFRYSGKAPGRHSSSASHKRQKSPSPARSTQATSGVWHHASNSTETNADASAQEAEKKEDDTKSSAKAPSTNSDTDEEGDKKSTKGEIAVKGNWDDKKTEETGSGAAPMLSSWGDSSGAKVVNKSAW